MNKCPRCNSIDSRIAGTRRNAKNEIVRQYQCKDCGRYFREERKP